MRAADPTLRGVVAGAAGALVFVLTALVPDPPEEIRVAPFDRFAEAIQGGAVPYRDFTVEYPPGSIAAVVAPLALPLSYDTAFRVVQTACGAALVVAVALLLRRAPAVRLVAAVALVALLPLLLGPVVVSRYDLLPAALVASSLLALETSRVRTSGALAGAAIAAKLYPIALLPALAAYARSRARLPLGRLFVPLAATLAAVSAGFVLVAPGGVAFGLSRQFGRGLQLESVGASAVLVGRWLGVASPGVGFTSGSQTLTGPAAQAASVVLSGVGLALLVALGAAVWRLGDGVDLRASSAALVGVALVCSKVLSPQFLVWLLPLALVVETGAWAWVAGALGAACVLTRMVYPTRYEELVRFEPGAVTLLVVRNALLVAVTGLLVAEVVRRVRVTRAVEVPVPAVGA